MHQSLGKSFPEHMGMTKMTVFDKNLGSLDVLITLKVNNEAKG